MKIAIEEEQAHGIAKALGVSEEIIGLTVIAVGTSLPELATSCVAAWRKQSDLAVGNVLGSNIWNIVFIMGAAAGVPKKELLERRVSPALEQLCDQRKNYVLSPQEHPLYPVEGVERTALIAFPIISAGDVCGSVVLLGEDSDQPSEAEEKLLCAAAGFLGKQMEE